MRRKIREKTLAAIAAIGFDEEITIAVGIATFFFGFLAGAVVNFYLLIIGNPLVLHYRTVLGYKSAILGDGIILPVINMIVMAFLLKRREYATKKIVRLALLAGFLITAYFHIAQAIGGIINWAMPTPWQWNFIGLWHGIYMFSVASFLSLFYLAAIRFIVKEKELPRQVLVVTLGLVIFFILLRLDYMAVDLTQFIPRL